MHDGQRPRTRKVTTKVLNLKNLRGQTLLFRCLEKGFVTTAPALTRYQKARGVDPGRRQNLWVKVLTKGKNSNVCNSYKCEGN